MSYDGRTFISKENSSNGEVDGRTRFHYRQSGSTVWAHYEGGDIVRGSLLGMADEQGNLHFCYYHLNVAGQVRAGECWSRPTRRADGKLRMNETWRWFNGDRSEGSSIVEEE